MRILVDLKSHLDGNPQIVQVEKEPVVGSEGRTPLNGRYVLPVPMGLEFPVDTNSYVLGAGSDVDGGDVVSQGFARLLAAFPQYGHVYFNPLLTADHVAELSFNGSFTDPSTGVVFTPRFQTGRPTGMAPEGQMPGHTALLPANTTVTPNRPGLILTDPIDISAYALDCDGNPAGADQFMLYWKLYKYEVSDDVASDWGATSGQNEPAIRYIEETDQEPSWFSAYLSVDGGANWCEVGLLEPVSFCTRTTEVLVAFKNTGTSKVYLANFALLF